MPSDEKNNLEPVGFLARKGSQFRKKILFFMLGPICILGFQYMSWNEKVIEIPVADYAKMAVDLKVTERVRYGFCLSYHGAFLVKTVNTEELNSAIADKEKDLPKREEKDKEQEENYEDAWDSISEPNRTEGEEDAGVRRAMRHELDLVPIKTMMETALYLGTFFFFFWGPSRLIKLRFLSSCSPFWRDFWAGSIAGMIGFWMMALPLIVLDYGPPLFSNWVGPGALSYSTGMRLLSSGGGMTISYRNVIEQIIFWPSVFYLAIAGIIPQWAQSPIFYAIFAPFYYGGIWGLCRAMWIDSRERKWRREMLLSSKE